MRGQIYSLEAYSRAKLLNHASWTGILPRNITPSDIDMILEIDGRILFIELSTSKREWAELSTGQYRLYKNLVLNGTGKHFAILAYIVPQPDEYIDTVRDVKKFQVMYYDKGTVSVSPVISGDKWLRAVKTLLGVENAS